MVRSPWQFRVLVLVMAAVVATQAPRRCQNTIAVRVAQDSYPNTWSSNPTMFQAELTLPAQAP